MPLLYDDAPNPEPQTLAYGLNDSPAGLAAYVLEKWRSWTDSKGDLDGKFSRKFLLTLLTIDWVAQSITTSMRDYFDNRWHGVRLAPGQRIETPTAIACFDQQFVFEGALQRELVERLYDVRRFSVFPRGGHFAPVEEPELVAGDIAASFGSIAK